MVLYFGSLNMGTTTIFITNIMFLRITEMLFSGPYNTYVWGAEPGLYFWGWRPLADQVGNTYPVCFIAEAVVGSVPSLY